MTLLKQKIKGSKNSLMDKMKIFKKHLSKKQFEFKIGNGVSEATEFKDLDLKKMTELINNGR